MENIERILSYGIPTHIFNEKFASLPDKEQKTLERVAQRLQTITKLEKEIVILSNPNNDNGDDYTFWRWELLSIQIYLYCTCIDTLAGQSKHIEINEWLKTQDVSEFNASTFESFYARYSDEFAVGKNFKKLFKNLSPAVKIWLNNNVAIQEFSEFSKYEISVDRNEDELINGLIDYFYKSWRNSFTHKSKTNPVKSYLEIDSRSDDYSGIAEFSESTRKKWVCQPSYFEINKKKWNLWHKRDIDPAIILRVIIHSAIFQKLKIKISNELVSKIVYLYQRLEWSYAYIRETRGNADFLDFWKEINEEHARGFVDNLRIHGIPSLSCKAASKFMEYFGEKYIFVREHTQPYIEHVIEINEMISRFNHDHPRLGKFHGQEEEKQCKQAIVVFLLYVSSQKSYTEVIKQSRQLWNEWILIRDNFELKP